MLPEGVPFKSWELIRWVIASGDSENAVRIQIYTAIISYCLVAIVHHKMKLKMSVYNTLQVLGISLTDTTPLENLFNKSNIYIDKEPDELYEPTLFDF